MYNVYVSMRSDQRFLKPYNTFLAFISYLPTPLSDDNPIASLHFIQQTHERISECFCGGTI